MWLSSLLESLVKIIKFRRNDRFAIVFMLHPSFRFCRGELAELEAVGE